MTRQCAFTNKRLSVLIKDKGLVRDGAKNSPRTLSTPDGFLGKLVKKMSSKSSGKVAMASGSCNAVATSSKISTDSSFTFSKPCKEFHRVLEMNPEPCLLPLRCDSV